MTKHATQKKSPEIRKRNVALLSLFTATSLAVLKFVYSILTGSLTMLASTIDSILDILASGINFFSIKESAKPPDAEHRYGHGKIESLAALFQSVIIFGSAVFIIYQAVITAMGEPKVTRLEEGIIVMLISTIASIYIARILTKTGKELDSTILQTDALHYATDIYQNIGVLLTMGIIYFTDWHIIDPIIGFLIGLYIVWQIWKIFRKAIDVLMDRELPPSIRRKISDIIRSHPDVQDHHNLRTRKSGTIMFVDFHLELSSHITLAKANTIAHTVEEMIQEKFPHAEILIHPDPYDDSHEDEKRREGVYGG